MRVEEGNILGYSLGSGVAPSGQRRHAMVLLCVCMSLSRDRRRAGVQMLQKYKYGGLCRKDQELCVKWKNYRGVHARSKGASC
jgi:hypothetical protein